MTMPAGSIFSPWNCGLVVRDPGEKGFCVRANSKTVILSADSVPSREEWMKRSKRSFSKLRIWVIV